MKNYRKHIDDFFREKLGRYTETPPADVWENLEGRLDGLATTPAPGNPFRWLWHVGIVSLLLVLSVSVVRKISGNQAAAGNMAANEMKAGSNTGTTKTVAGSATQAANEPAANNETVPGKNESAQNNVTGNNNQQTDNQRLPGAARTSSNKTKSANNQTTNTIYAGTTTNNPIAQATSNTYHSSLAKPGPASEETNDNDQVTSSPNTTLSTNSKATPVASPTPVLPGTLKQNQANTNKSAAKNSSARSKRDFDRFELGIKGGYEAGYTEGAAQKLVIAPYLQYNLSRKLSIMLQPALKYANAGTQNVGSAQSYYDESPYTETAGDKSTHGDPILNTVTVGSKTDTINWSTSYTTTRIHDSIVKSNRTGGSYMEFEMPVLLKYNLTKKVSVYGGVNMVYSRLTGVSENTSTVKGISKSVTEIIYTPNYPTTFTPPSVTYNVPSISTYKDQLITPPSNQMNVGYMVGFTYNYSKRWLIDALMEQTPIAPEVKGGYNINTPLSAPYFRLSVGYTLLK